MLKHKHATHPTHPTHWKFDSHPTHPTYWKFDSPDSPYLLEIRLTRLTRLTHGTRVTPDLLEIRLTGGFQTLSVELVYTVYTV